MNDYFSIVKSYLLDLEYNIVSEDAAEELVVIEKDNDGIHNVIVDCEDSIVIIEGLLFEFAKGGNEKVFKKLLQLNRNVVHGAFVLDETGKKVLFRDTLALENLDCNELEGSLNSLKLIISEYGMDLIEFSKQ